MKRKITKVSNVKDLQARLAGVAVWRVTGPNKFGERITVNFTGTRAEAEALNFNSYVSA